MAVGRLNKKADAANQKIAAPPTGTMMVLLKQPE
jgi:hypothetical protein